MTVSEQHDLAVHMEPVDVSESVKDVIKAAK